MSRNLPESPSLDAQETRFLAHYLELGGRPENGPEAAKRAGYGKTEKDARRAAAILLGTPRIVDAILREAKEQLNAAAGAAVATLIELSKEGPAPTRLAASKEILDRSKIGPVISRSASVQVRTIEDVIMESDELRKAERQKRAQSAAQDDSGVVDADWSEISDEGHEDD